MCQVILVPNRSLTTLTHYGNWGKEMNRLKIWRLQRWNIMKIRSCFRYTSQLYSERNHYNVTVFKCVLKNDLIWATPFENNTGQSMNHYQLFINSNTDTITPAITPDTITPDGCPALITDYIFIPWKRFYEQIIPLENLKMCRIPWQLGR